MKFLLTVFPGLATLAGEELHSKMDLVPVASARVRGSDLLWVQTSHPAGLLELDLIEDVFVAIDKIKLTGSALDLKLITKTLASSEGLAAAIRVYTHLTGRKVSAKGVFRVVAQADDAAWRTYRRVDMQVAAQAGIVRGYPTWRLDTQEAPIEVWLHQDRKNLSISLRLTNGMHRARGGRAVEREAALRPTIAAAMVYASGVGDEDVFLDPMCGSGTILLERATTGRYGLLLGGDIDPLAVKAALANFGPRHQPRRIERMDARALPLEDASVDKLVTNLPWGQQISTPEKLPALYKGVLNEAARVVRSGGVIVMLTSEGAMLLRIIKTIPGLKSERKIADIEVLGRRAGLFRMVRS